jgi:CRP/FNR family cyclic AMP-dependent transcriptional regulator
VIKLLGKSFTDKELQLIQFLQKDKLFERLNERELSYFLPYLHERKYGRDEVIFFAGDPSQALYFVKSGTVTLNIDLKDNFERLMTLRAGYAFGDNSLIAGAKRIYSAISVTESSVVYVIPQVNLLEIMDNHTKIRGKVMTSFCETYNGYTTQLFKAYRKSLGFFDLNEVYSSVD